MKTEVICKLQRGMTVSDLIDELRNYDQDDLVVFGCDYGDHCHTEQALPIQEVGQVRPADGVRVVESAYSHSGLAIQQYQDYHNEDEWEAEANDDEAPTVVVLR